VPAAPPSVKKLAYYITAHGYGHGVRSCDILRGVATLYPEIPVVVVSDLPEDFLRNRLPAGAAVFRRAAFDVGMIQLDSIRVDLAATRREVAALYARHDELVQRESAWMAAEGVGVAAADLPSIPLAAAARAGAVPVAVGNFAWDWIYEEFLQRGDAGWGPVLRRIREDYAAAELLLRIPFAGPMTAFRCAEDIPLLARPGRARRAELAQATGADPGRPWALLSFTSLEWDAKALDRVEAAAGWEFFTVRPLAWPGRRLHAIDRGAVPFSDVLASCDVAVSKPGYGILSDCAANATPLVYAERTDFREYEVLVAAMSRFHRAVHIPSERLYAGDLGPYLDAARAAPPAAETMPRGGEFVAARRLAGFLGLPARRVVRPPGHVDAG
jgi:hypothetical protein